MVLHVKAQGHAGYSAEGNDIVCAGISMLVQAFAQWLYRRPFACEMLEDRMEPGDVEWVVLVREGEALALAVLDMLTGGFELLAEKYPECVKVGRK